jgi:hypothetical protein
MPVVPTSQVSVIPTAPRVDIQSFVPKLDPTAGLGTFMAAAQLPLAMEQIDLQREKNKAERTQLDFLKKQTEYNIRNYDAIQDAARKQAELDADIKRQNLARAKIETDAARLELEGKKPVDPAVLSAYFMATPSGDGTATGDTGATGIPPLAGATISPTGQPVPLEDVTVEAKEPTKEEVEARQAAEREARYSYVPDMSTVELPFTGESEDQIRARNYNKRLQRALGTGESISQNRFDEIKLKVIPTIEDELKPNLKAKYQFTDGRGTPMVLEVVTIGDDIVRIRDPKPKIDTETLYKESPALKTFDDAYQNEVAKDLAKTATSRAQITKLMTAVELYAKAEESGGLVDRSQLLGLLPDKVVALLSPDKLLSRDQVRSAIQQTLRETLGAQFTAGEGTSMMDRSFNLLLPPDANVMLVKQAVQLAETLIRDREDRAGYFGKNKTLFGFKPEGGLILSDGSPNLDRLEQIAKKLNPTGTAAPGGATPPPAGPTEQQVKTGADLLTKARANYNASLGSVAKAAAQKP